MAGIAGRGGQNRVPLATHITRGSYRPARHGPRPDHVVAMPDRPVGWTPSAAALKKLQTHGRAAVRAFAEAHEEISYIEGQLLLFYGDACDHVAHWMAVTRAAPNDQRASRLLLHWEKRACDLLRDLRARP